MLYSFYNFNDVEFTNYQGIEYTMQILGFGLTGLLKLLIGV